MPSLNINWLKDNLKNDNIEKDYPVFIETGTLYGNTIIPLEKYFTELHTIEIKKELFDHVKKTYNNSKINFHLGDSGEMLAKICPDIKLNTIFFLDGHWSSNNTGKGDKDVPLYEELKCIMEYLKHKCIIIIDDCFLFGKGPNKGDCNENWEDINTPNILKLVNPRIEKFYFGDSDSNKNDRLVIFLNENS